jgi:D-alanine-D-alanine ligase
MDLGQMIFREEPTEADLENVREIVASSGFFYREEIDVAVDLVRERLLKGLSSGYYFFFVELNGEVLGYACYGPIACTITSYDLFWIAVGQAARGLGIGQRVLQRVEEKIRHLGGSRIYVETSSRELYRPTHRFYRSCGYEKEAMIRDFYAPGDHKILYLKIVQPFGIEAKPFPSLGGARNP